MNTQLKRRLHSVRRRLYSTIERDHMEAKWVPTYTHLLGKKNVKATRVDVLDHRGNTITRYEHFSPK